MMAEDRTVKHKKAWEQLYAVKANSSDVLELLYQDNYPKIRTYVLSNKGTEEQAKDILQEAFIAMWRNVQLDRFEPDSDTALNGYLYRIAKNKWLDHLRSAHHTKVVSINAELPEQVEDGVSHEENEYITAVRKHYRTLGAACKDVLERFYFNNESLKLIAAAMSWTEATARNNKYRCIQRLKELISNK